MVGQLLDAMTARAEKTSAAVILSRGNRIVAALPLGVRITFWLTNLPYFALTARLFADADVASAHAIAVGVVALASTCFHGAILFGAALPPALAPRLMALDLVAANGYGIVLMALRGLRRVLALFAVPVCVLVSSAVLKRRQRPMAYAALHGLWHVLSAAASKRCRLRARPLLHARAAASRARADPLIRSRHLCVRVALWPRLPQCTLPCLPWRSKRRVNTCR